MFIKLVSPAGWDFDAPTVAGIKIAAAGLRGADRAAFIKRASHVFLPFIDTIKFAADEEPVHLIALGASEAWGPNRNGDGFKEATLLSCHDTFTKYAKWYRNHKNKDPQQSYGVIKMSAYNPVMRRVELLVGLNKTAEAAERNGGLIADRELEKLARGEDIAVSMACRVPFDVCAGCGNKARTREEYCKEASCKYGGCADNLTKIIKIGGDLFISHVDNPGPAFFDISDVFRPADRTAYGNRADWLQKLASDGDSDLAEMAKIAADIRPPVIVAMEQDAADQPEAIALQIKLAHGLAAMPTSVVDVRRAFAAEVQPNILAELNLTGDPTKTAEALGALADEAIILPLREFAEMVKAADSVAVAALRLPGVYQRMIDDGSLVERIEQNPYAPTEKLASAKVREIATKYAPSHSLDKMAVVRRCQLSVIRGLDAPAVENTFYSEKTAGETRVAEELARAYAVYKLAALHRIAAFDSEFPLTLRISACQNQVV